MANENKRQFEMQIPDDMVQKLDQLNGGIKPILTKIEKEYGLSTSVSSVESKHYTIFGPSPEILDLAIENLERRIKAQGELENDDSRKTNEADDKRAVWKFFGDYARKATHLFLSELKDLQKVSSVIVQETKHCLEITCSQDDTDTVKPAVSKLEHALHDLYEDEVKITAKGKEMERIHNFIRTIQLNDKTIFMVLDEDANTVKISGKEKNHTERVADELRTGKAALVLPMLVKSKKFKHQLKLPVGIVKKLEKQKGGIFPIITAIEKEFGLEVKYVRDKHFTLFGPNMDILDLMAQTLFLRHVMKAPPENSILGMLQRQNAVWKFLGEYAKKLNHLFKRELAQIERMKTVTVRAFPCQMNPVCVEILCSVKVAEYVKAEVDKLVALLHKLYENNVTVPDKETDKQNVREFMRHIHEHNCTVLCILDEETRTVTISGRNLYLTRQVANEVQALVTAAPQTVPVPDKLKHMYRQLYKTQLNEEIVKKLQKRPGGILPIVQRMEKEFGLQALYHKNNVALVSPSTELLELAIETFESRYVADINRPSRLGIIRKKKPLKVSSIIEKC